MKITSILLMIFLPWNAFPQSRGNGDRIDSLPNLLERQLLVLTNACRMAPVQYRDLYIGNNQILLPANYPAVRPLYWSAILNRAARIHAVDMANNCGMQHNSCDGTAWNVRIRSYYTESQTIAENIAAGNTTALATVRQWVLEGTPVPADRSAGDGHRQNIMNGSYRELGAGYAQGPQRYTYFWVQDFGGGAPDFSSPLVAGCHCFIETGKTTFFANYGDSLVAPTEFSCVIDNQSVSMTFAMGSGTPRGTYTLVQTKAAGCRQYYFTCTRSGTQFRYPEKGMLVTAGEGSCSKEYIPPESLSVRSNVVSSRCITMRCRYLSSGNLLITNLPSPWTSGIILVTDLQGQTLSRIPVRPDAAHATRSLIIPFSGTQRTLCMIRVSFDGRISLAASVAPAPE